MRAPRPERVHRDRPQKGFLGNLIRPAPAAAPQAAAADAPGSTGVGPRLEAFNMARGGAPRHEVAQHLKEKFGLDDPSEILDDAFSRAGNSPPGVPNRYPDPVDPSPPLTEAGGSPG